MINVVFLAAQALTLLSKSLVALLLLALVMFSFPIVFIFEFYCLYVTMFFRSFYTPLAELKQKYRSGMLAFSGFHALLDALAWVFGGNPSVESFDQYKNKFLGKDVKDAELSELYYLLPPISVIFSALIYTVFWYVFDYESCSIWAWCETVEEIPILIFGVLFVSLASGPILYSKFRQLPKGET